VGGGRGRRRVGGRCRAGSTRPDRWRGRGTAALPASRTGSTPYRSTAVADQRHQLVGVDPRGIDVGHTETNMLDRHHRSFSGFIGEAIVVACSEDPPRLSTGGSDPSGRQPSKPEGQRRRSPRGWQSERGTSRRTPGPAGPRPRPSTVSSTARAGTGRHATPGANRTDTRNPSSAAKNGTPWYGLGSLVLGS